MNTGKRTYIKISQGIQRRLIKKGGKIRVSYRSFRPRLRIRKNYPDYDDIMDDLGIKRY